ncbi:hypothetical protein [Fusobacterium vincentii]|uniref:hypothetical protein n=1 Tax=Fusobacterium vincentii TaxID=155615 RepID=UPI0030D420E5
MNFSRAPFISIEDNNTEAISSNKQHAIGWYNISSQSFEVTNLNAGFTALLIGKI